MKHKFITLPKDYTLVTENILSKYFRYEGCVHVVLQHKGKKIGWVELRIRSRKGELYVFETHSRLGSKYRNRGFGALMYHKAFLWVHKNGHKVRCSGVASFYARRVWRSKALNEFWNIREVQLSSDRTNWTVIGKR